MDMRLGRESECKFNKFIVVIIDCVLLELHISVLIIISPPRGWKDRKETEGGMRYEGGSTELEQSWKEGEKTNKTRRTTISGGCN